MWFQEYVSEGISHPAFYCDLVYKLRKVKYEANFVSSGSKIAKRLRRRKYDSLIIERTICLVLGPSTALYRSFLKRCTLTNKAVGTIWRASSKHPQRRQGPDPRPIWLLVGTPSVVGPELAYRLHVAQPTLMYVPRYFWYITYFIHVCVPQCKTFLWPHRFGWMLVLNLYKEDYLQIFKYVSFWFHGCCGKWEGWVL